MEKLKDKYGLMTVKELKCELKRRNAALHGRKKDLIDRLIFFERNDNFYNSIQDPSEKKEEPLTTPSPSCYKDVNSTSPVPTLTEEHINYYMKLFDKNIGISKEMYEGEYLHFVRFCMQDDLYFVKSKCSAQMKKHVTYEVNISIKMDGEVSESSCECVNGRSGKQAHCKHVGATLFGVLDMKTRKEIVTKQTSTEKLQTFHQPRKRYSGSPIKAKDMKTKRYESTVRYNPNDSSDEDDITYNNYFQNIIKSRAFGNNMALKQLTIPANPFAYCLDHDYEMYDLEYTILKELYLFDVTLIDVEKIELETMDQSQSNSWHEYRRVRITASRFYECCKNLNENQSKKLAQSILNPQKFTSRPTAHGKLYEKKAIEMFEQCFLKNALKVDNCGLLIMKDYPFIGASPDGLLCELSVVEVKCPYAARYLIINEKNVDFLSKNDRDEYSLCKDHPYYFQVQGQLMVTGRHYCDFIVYTFKSLIRITVERDEAFITTMLRNLCSFYKKYLKPAVLNEFLYRDYDTTISCQCFNSQN